MANRGRYFLNCIAAGTCAALAGTSAKLISSDVLPITPHFVRTAFCVSGLVVFNILMWVNFTTAMQGMRTVTATSCTTTVNFLVSGFTGWVLFGEVVTVSWLVGVGLIVVGVILLNSDSDKTKEE